MGYVLSEEDFIFCFYQWWENKLYSWHSSSDLGQVVLLTDFGTTGMHHVQFLILKVRVSLCYPAGHQPPPRLKRLASELTGELKQMLYHLVRQTGEFGRERVLLKSVLWGGLWQLGV